MEGSFKEELGQIEFGMFLLLCKVNQSLHLPRKLYVELTQIISTIAKKRFFEDGALEKNDLLVSIIAMFEVEFSLALLDTLTTIFE